MYHIGVSCLLPGCPQVSPPIANFQETIVCSVDPTRAKVKAEAKERVAAGVPATNGAAPADGDGDGGEDLDAPVGPGAAARSLEAASMGSAGVRRALVDDLEACVQQDAETGVVRAASANRAACVVLRAVPLPEKVTTLLSEHQDLLRRAAKLRRVAGGSVARGVPPAMPAQRRSRSGSVDDDTRTATCVRMPGSVCGDTAPWPGFVKRGRQRAHSRRLWWYSRVQVPG